MAKFQSPLLGYNNNVRHRGRIFHIQTEDSGVNHPHIITHLFMDGGRILKSVKKSYAEHVGSDGMSETVRVLMKEQHKAMFIALRDGQFDVLVDPKAAASPAARVEVAPANVEIAMNDVAAVPPIAEAPALSAVPATHPDPPRAEDIAPNTIAEERRPSHVQPEPVPHILLPPAPPVTRATEVKERGPAKVGAPSEPHAGRPDVDPQSVTDPSMTFERAAATADESLRTTRGLVTHEARASEGRPEPEKRRKSAQELTLDFDALERDSHSPGVSPYFHTSDLPPPPKNLFAKEPRTGAYSAVDADAHHDTTRVPQGRTPQQPPVKPSAPPRSASQKPASEGRYTPARPAAIFGAAAKPSPSIFSDDLVSDKSLDEVILSYLAEDLEPPRRK